MLRGTELDAMSGMSVKKKCSCPERAIKVDSSPAELEEGLCSLNPARQLRRRIGEKQQGGGGLLGSGWRGAPGEVPDVIGKGEGGVKERPLGGGPIRKKW